MPKSVNKVILVGNVGQDPEVKYTPSGIPVGKFSLATNERFKDKNGEFQKRTEWHNIVAWQREIHRIERRLKTRRIMPPLLRHRLIERRDEIVAFLARNTPHLEATA